jgi:hypothetical protein
MPTDVLGDGACLEGRCFLIAGVQKGGTTALFDYLRDHPQLNLAPEKEVHFFDDEAQDWSAPDYDAFHARFAPAGPGRISGEATPIYTYWPDSLERIRAYNPEMKLILLFRDPIARAWLSVADGVTRGAPSRSLSAGASGRDADVWPTARSRASTASTAMSSAASTPPSCDASSNCSRASRS